MTLRTRIAAAAGLAVAVAVVAATAIVYFAIRSELRGEVERGLRARAATVTRFVEGPFGPGRLRRGDQGGLAQDAEATPFGGAAAYAQLLRPNGDVLTPRRATLTLPVTSAALDVARLGSAAVVADQHVAGIHLLVLTAPLPGVGAIQVARPLDEVDRELARVLLVLVVVGLAGIALAAGLGAVVARTALRPIGRFTRRTEALAADPDPDQRMEVAGRDELARLAQSFNATLDALARSVEAQRHLVADASHELRTPIASLRANIQILQDADRLPPEDRESLRADIVSELDELTALVGDVVELARGAKPRDGLDDVRLDEVVESAAERARRRAVDLEIAVRTEPTVVAGEPERIARAVSNLLDNACKWSPPGGLVEVELAAGTLSVRDHGPGFDEADLPHVFERFYRAADARGMPGSGLGLAIVRQAAEAHGGWVEASNAPGGGALLRVSFGAPLPASYAAPTVS